MKNGTDCWLSNRHAAAKSHSHCCRRAQVQQQQNTVERNGAVPHHRAPALQGTKAAPSAGPGS